MADRYWVGKYGGYWADSNNWSSSSNGGGGASIPTQDDNVFFDNNSFIGSGKTVAINGSALCLNFNFSPGTPSYLSGELNVYGHFSTNPNAYLTNARFIFRGTLPADYTNAAAVSVGQIEIYKDTSDSGLRLLSNLKCSGSVGVRRGMFYTNGKNVVATYLGILSTGGVRINVANSVITLSDSLNLSDIQEFIATNSTIIFTGSNKYLKGFGQTFYNIEARNSLTITGSNTFNDIKLPTSKTVHFQAGATQTINSLSANGTKGDLVYLRSNVDGRPFTLQSANTITVERYSIKDSFALGNFAAVKSYDLGNNTGWNIQAPGNEVIYRDVVFDNRYFVSGAIQTQVALAGDSLAYDTMHLKVWHDGYTPPLGYDFYTADDETFLTSDSEDFLCLDTIDNFVPGDSMTYYYDDILINRFYVQEVKQVGKQLYDVYAVSAIGILDNSMHFGGIYNGTNIEDILAELFAGTIYEVDELVKTIKVYGWLPYATKRDNLQQLTLAHSISVKPKSDGTLLITSHRNIPTGNLGENRTSLMGAVERLTPATAVQVSEHKYDEDTTVITLCDETFLTERLILFPEPCHDLSITNGTIISYSANHAYVQGTGAVTLTGQIYIHNMQRVTYGTVAGNSSDNILFVDNATLVTSLNSSKVAQKLYNAFSKDEVIKTDIIFGDEQTGDVVEIINPYTSVTETAFARQMDISFGGFLKARAEFLKGFEPAGVITGYQNRVILTENQTWTVPDGVTEIRAVLLGGGQGGAGGENGASGEDGSRLPSSLNKQGTQDDIENGTHQYLQGYNGEGGTGGLAGLGGYGGKVLDTGALSVTPLEDILVTIGAGGGGGAAETTGAEGGNTIFGAYSSAAGEPLSRGYTDLITGNVYGIPGCAGKPGKNGLGKSNFGTPDNYYDGYTSGTTYWRPPGNWGLTYYSYIYYLSDPIGSRKWLFGVGGSGGGGAWAASWSDGLAATHGLDGDTTHENNGNGFAEGGNGGPGRTPQVGSNATVYGAGGHGGHGGGGGGGGGAYANFWGGESYEWKGSGGAGGLGSKGGNGKAGCVIIYY